MTNDERTALVNEAQARADAAIDRMNRHLLAGEWREAFDARGAATLAIIERDSLAFIPVDTDTRQSGAGEGK